MKIEINYFLFSKSLLDCEKDLYTDLLFIFDDEFEKYHKFENSANKRSSVHLQEYADKMIHHILTPIKSLLKSLNGPNILISKRNHKLLDYENALLDTENKTLNQKEVN